MANKQKRLKKKDRAELERRFIGRILFEANYGDIREIAAGYRIGWRQFSDRRHRVIWRALETLNLRSIEERMDTIEKEAYGSASANPMVNVPGDDLVRGEAGSAASKQFKKKLIDESSQGILWLERELEAVEALKLAGGRIYLRALAETGDYEVLSPESLAGDLFGRGILKNGESVGR